MKDNIVGLKYYKFIGEEVKVIRISRIKDGFYSVIDEKTKQHEKVTPAELYSDYTLLRPDGYVTFMLLDLSNNMKDVMVVFHRKEDITADNNIPYAICRQFIDDVFTNLIVPKGYHCIGLSISQESCPAEIDFRYVLMCDGVNRQEMVAVYADDKLNTILSLINKKKYNDVLTGIYNSQAKPFLIGLCQDLKTLLLENNFMYDFYRGFNIQQIPFTIDPEFEGSFTNMDIVHFIENNIVRTDITMTYVTKFSKEINLREIKKDFIIISDNNDNLFLVAYDKADINSKSYEDILNHHTKVSEDKKAKYNI